MSDILPEPLMCYWMGTCALIISPFFSVKIAEKIGIVNSEDGKVVSNKSSAAAGYVIIPFACVQFIFNVPQWALTSAVLNFDFLIKFYARLLYFYRLWLDHDLVNYVDGYVQALCPPKWIIDMIVHWEIYVITNVVFVTAIINIVTNGFAFTGLE